LQEDIGLIPRICETLFDRCDEEADSSTTYTVEVSYLEIYNEKVKDLLVDAKANSSSNLRVREHPKSGPFVDGLSTHTVGDFDSIDALMEQGNANRTTAATNMNDTSSRSHAVFTILFKQVSPTISAGNACYRTIVLSLLSHLVTSRLLSGLVCLGYSLGKNVQNQSGGSCRLRADVFHRCHGIALEGGWQH
jgi:hypothetical protein